MRKNCFLLQKMTEKKAKLRINTFMIKLMIDNSKCHFHRKCEGIPFVSKERILIGFTIYTYAV